MVAFTVIPSSSLEAGKPAKSSDIIAIRDNATHARDLAISESAGLSVSSRCLHTDALRISGANIQLVKASGASEAINIGQITKSLAVGSIGSTAYLVRSASGASSLPTIGPGTLVPASQLAYPYSSASPVGTWRVLSGLGYIYSTSNPPTLFIRVS